jgi:hydroxymethylbilane synthase
VLVTQHGGDLFSLEAGARVGTSSLRRAVQLHRERNDLAFAVLRGNVGTRLRKMDEGEVAAAVLALAGLKRLGLDRDRKFFVLPVEQSIPAVGQGALGIETREDAKEVRALLAPLEHRKTRIAVECERAFLSRLHGSCTTPLAAHARFVDGRFRIDAMVGAIDGSRVLVTSDDSVIDLRDPIPAARALGAAAADRLLAEGAAEIVASARSASDPYAGLYAK